jgi:predicted RNA binding protein YcfA (HicA-like mRNA interferase family)
MKLPVLSGLKIVKALGKIGFEVDHQTDSHFILRENKEPFRRATIPNHKTIAPGTLLAIIKQTGLQEKNF